MSELREKERTRQHSAKPTLPATPKAARTGSARRHALGHPKIRKPTRRSPCARRIAKFAPVPTPLRFTFWIATLGALASAAAYALTFADRTYYWVLALLPLLLLVWLGVVTQWRRVPRRNLVSEIFGDIPRWMKVAVVGLLVFVFANYLACRALNAAAQPNRLPDGRLMLVARGGEVVRELDAAGFSHAQAVQLRMLDGTLITCFGLAALLAQACWIKNSTAMADREV